MRKNACRGASRRACRPRARRRRSSPRRLQRLHGAVERGAHDHQVVERDSAVRVRRPAAAGALGSVVGRPSSSSEARSRTDHPTIPRRSPGPASADPNRADLARVPLHMEARGAPRARAGPRRRARPPWAVPWPWPSGRTLEPRAGDGCAWPRFLRWERSSRGRRCGWRSAEAARTCLLLPGARRLRRVDRHRPLRAHGGVRGLPAPLPPEAPRVGGGRRPGRGAPPDTARGARAPLGRPAGGAGVGGRRAAGHRARLLGGVHGLRHQGAARRGGAGRRRARAGRGRLRDRDRRARRAGSASRTSTRPRSAACAPTPSIPTTRWRSGSSRSPTTWSTRSGESACCSSRA